MKVCILKPRLDCMFKKGHVPDVKGPTPYHRLPFENFVNRLVEEYTFRGDEVKVVEKGLVPPVAAAIPTQKIIPPVEVLA